jgi:hypothetical protein
LYCGSHREHSGTGRGKVGAGKDVETELAEVEKGIG